MTYYQCRGTASKKHWNSNLDYGKIDIDIANDFKLNDLDKRDGLNVDAVDFDGSICLAHAFKHHIDIHVQIQVAQ